MSTNDKLTPGMVLGRYELLIPIAQGGMATVWAARQKGSRGFQKTVAIKTMLPTLSEDPQFEQMFLDEAALAAKIHHPNVCEILDLGEQDEILYIVMEWIDGEAISIVHKAARKAEQQLPLRLAMRAVMQACAGLHAAHELRDENDIPLELVHRDVSPQNILVTYDGIVKLVDFGVAKAVGRGGGETNAGQLKGKVPYMSPEQARGADVDRRTDIFAMGIVLYKLTTGLHPFMGENDLVTMKNIISRPLLPPRMKNPGFPIEIEQILVKCLQKDADKRYQTMAELGLAIERALANMGIAEDDLGAYVRQLMGDRGAKRRAAIRDAVRQADERFATGVHQAVVPAHLHEGVSEIILTKVNSGVGMEPIGDRPSQVTSGLLMGATTGTHAPAPESVTTGQPLVAIPDPTAGRRGRSGLIAGGVVALAALGIAGFVVLKPGGPAGGGVNAKLGAQPTASAIATQSPVPTATASAAPAASAAPSAAASQAPAQASAAPSGTVLSINSLPDVEEGKQRGKGTVPKASASPTAVAAAPTAVPTVAPVSPTADPAPKPAEPKPQEPVKHVTTDKVPIFINPGF